MPDVGAAATGTPDFVVHTHPLLTLNCEVNTIRRDAALSRAHSFPVRRLAELDPIERRIDVAQQAGEHAARAYFQVARHTLPRQIPDGLQPAYRVRHLLIDSFARLGAQANFAGLPVVHQRARQVAKLRGAQIRPQAFLRRRHQRLRADLDATEFG